MEKQFNDTQYRYTYSVTLSDHVFALLCAGTAFAVYFFTLAPTVTGEDSGELIAAAYSLGVPHPPGYPLWCLLARATIELIPYGEVAWRVGLLSSIFAALTVYVVALTILYLTHHFISAGAGALALAFSREFWEQSVIAEVYTLNAFFLALCLYLLVRWSTTYSRRPLYAFALVFGLSLTNHHSMLLLAPVFLVFILVHDGWPLTRRIYVSMGLLFLAGLLPYAYLPIRSFADPAMDWGNPQTPGGFIDVVFRRQYHHMIADQPWTPVRFLLQCWTFLKVYAWEFTPWVGWLIVPGFVFLQKLGKSIFALLLASFLVTALGAIVVPNFPIEFHWIWMNTTYWIPVYTIAAVLLGIALAGLYGRRLLPGPAVRALAFIIVLSPLLSHYRHNDRSQDFLARDYAQNLLDTLPTDAVYVGSGDHTVFPLTYLQIVEGQRPDVVIANKYGYPEPSVYATMPAADRATIGRRPSKADTNRIIQWLLAESDRPLYSVVERPPGPRTRVNAGLLYRYLRPDEQPEERNYWAEYTWKDLEPKKSGVEWSESLILYEIELAHARGHFENGEQALAVRALLNAQNLIRGDKQGLNNLGVLAARHGELEIASDLFAAALESDPTFATVQLNLARARYLLGDLTEALELVTSVLKAEPGNGPATRLHKKILRDENASQLEID